MKKYILVTLILTFSISAVIYYALRFKNIDLKMKQYSHIEESTYEMEIINSNQKLTIGSLRASYNYDDIEKSTLLLNNKTKKYIDLLLDTDDTTLINYAYVIQENIENLNYLYEDIKTDTAEIKNSLKWLSTNYKKHLITKEEYNSEDIELVKYIFDLLNIASQSDIFIQIDPFKGDTKNLKIYRLGTHLDIIYNEYNKLMSLKKQLDDNDIIPSLNIVNQHVKSVREEIHEEISYIITSLLISSIFLLIYGVMIYIKEALSKLETERLKNNLEQFVNALNESAIVSKTDIYGKITFVNERFCQVSGYKKDELIGQPHNIVRHPDMDSAVFKDLWNTIQNNRIFRATIKNRKKSGEFYYVDTVVIPMTNIKNEITEYLAVRYEVTELIQSRDLAIIAEKAKGEFLSNMSHELRTPLNAIVGFASILNKQIKDSEHSRYLQTIIASSEHLIGLINDILDLSKLQSGNFSLDYYDFNLDEKLELFLHHFDAQLEIAELYMKKELDPSIHVALHADWLRISQIITNLISNAIKFSEKGSFIEFGVKYENSELHIIVKDNGIGISKESQDKIFKPFQQADTSTTRKYGGTGLGLSIVLNLIEQMKGHIELTSKEGEGSRFEVILPIKEAKRIDEENKYEDEKEFSLLDGHILIAEDNKTNQMLIGLLVEDLGLTYTIADNGVDAIDKFSKEKFDLILMDENMPKMNGLEAMNRIRSMDGGDLPIISLTANVMQGDRERFLDAGMNGYVAKPIDEKELYNELKSFLNEK